MPPGPAVPGYLGPGQSPLAAHKPGAVPLRPLKLGDIFDAAFKIVRFNPQATVGASALLALVTMAPTIAVAVGALSTDSLLPTDVNNADTADFNGLLALLGLYGLGTLAKSIGTVLLTGVIVHVVMAASIGRRLTLDEAWRATRGGRWRLLGLTLLITVVVLVVLALFAGFWFLFLQTSPSGVMIALVALVTLPLLFVLMVWAWVRCTYLAVPALMLEQIGIFAALGRALVLSRRQFWRLFGIATVTSLVAGIAGYLVGLPFNVVGQVIAGVALSDNASRGLAVVLLTSAVGTVASTAIVTPFTAAVNGLQYVDQRMRKEAFDIELMRRAGILGD